MCSFEKLHIGWNKLHEPIPTVFKRKGSKMPDENKLTLPLEMQKLYRAFHAADSVVLRKYITSLSSAPCIEMDSLTKGLGIGDNVALYRIAQIVYDKNENTQDKLTTVYSMVLAMKNSSLAMLLCGHVDHVDLFLGVVTREYQKKANGELFVDTKNASQQSAAVRNAFLGNFPGSILKPVNNTALKRKVFPAIDGQGKTDIIKQAFKDANYIAAVSSIPAARSNQRLQNSELIQGLEKLIDTLRGKEYTVLFLSDAVNNDQIEEMCASYEDLYSQLAPFRTSTYTVNAQDSVTDTESFIKGTVETTNKSIAKTLTQGTSISKGYTDSAGVSVHVGTPVGGGVHCNQAYSRNRGVSSSTSNTETKGTAHSLTEQNSVAKALSSSKGESVQLNYENRAVKTLLDRLDEQIKRMRGCEDFGMFSTCAYFAARTYQDAVSAASAFRSITRGENSSVEASAVNVWKDTTDVKYIKDYLEHFSHPEFLLCLSDEQCYPTTAAMLISGKEMAYQMPLPKKSVAGIAVVECAEFGREVIRYDQGDDSAKIELGYIYHMCQKETLPVELDCASLTSHVFITGSTGTGKSNAVYTLLKALCMAGNTYSTPNVPQPKFLVIEPAKGEYKDVFGGYKGVRVLGTNPHKTPLLKLNPFTFPQDTHVLEHIDRLVEIFNACWPMYAAMPAVLKAAIEQAYQDCGWDIASSFCFGTQRFPTFYDVARALPTVVDEKKFSNDTQSDYKGALLTRLESLTNGINGQVLCAWDALPDTELFDENVIVDLSRVGSPETKALLMGVLILKLQEYRMHQRANGNNLPNSGLRHVTVLEEAHNLLRRTSTEQSQESSNLQGKSVEMLTNAIAEMRTYGEGFVIADQAPGLLDMAAIRNTNTKIIFRLPDEEDRELVGKAAGLNEDQIVELSRLDTGVAAVYQNQWLEPVLCKVPLFDIKLCKEFQYELVKASVDPLSEKIYGILLPEYTGDVSMEKGTVDDIRAWIDRQRVGEAVRKLLYKVLLEKKPLQLQEKQYALYCLAKGKKLIRQAQKTAATFPEICTMIDLQIEEFLQVSEIRAQQIRQQILLYAAANTSKDSISYQDLVAMEGIR